MQIIENRTHVEGLLQHVEANSDIEGFGTLQLAIRHTAPVGGMADLFSARSAEFVRVYVPQHDLTHHLKPGQTVKLVVRIAPQDHVFAQPDTLHTTE